MEHHARQLGNCDEGKFQTNSMVNGLTDVKKHLKCFVLGFFSYTTIILTTISGVECYEEAQRGTQSTD